MRVCLCGITTILRSVNKHQEVAYLHAMLTYGSGRVVIDKAYGYSCARNIRAGHLGLLHKHHHRLYLASVTERYTLPIARLFPPRLEIAHSSLDFILIKIGMCCSCAPTWWASTATMCVCIRCWVLRLHAHLFANPCSADMFVCQKCWWPNAEHIATLSVCATRYSENISFLVGRCS
jgi:hypothetical protein